MSSARRSPTPPPSTPNAFYSHLNGHNVKLPVGLAHAGTISLSDDYVNVGQEPLLLPATNHQKPLVSPDIEQTDPRITTVTKPRRRLQPAPRGSSIMISQPDPSVPALYRIAVSQLELPIDHIRDAFQEPGIRVRRCYSAWRYRRDVIEEWVVDLLLSPCEALIKLTNVRDLTSRLLLPDLYLKPQSHPNTVECFADYQWPGGDKQLLDTKHTPLVAAHFRNCREPIIFVSENEFEQQKLMTILLTVQRVGHIQHRARLRASCSILGRCPEDLGHTKSPHFSRQIATAFLEQLSDASQKLCTSHAVSQYWLRSQQSWILYWDKEKARYVRARVGMTINRMEPYLMIVDSKAKFGKEPKVVLRPHLDVVSHSCTRRVVPRGLKQTWHEFIRSEQLSPHVTFVDSLEPTDIYPHDAEEDSYGGATSSAASTLEPYSREIKVFFSFETTEQLKDFQQVLATLSYLQICRVDASMGAKSPVGDLSSARALSENTKCLPTQEGAPNPLLKSTLKRPPSTSVTFNGNDPRFDPSVIAHATEDTVTTSSESSPLRYSQKSTDELENGSPTPSFTFKFGGGSPSAAGSPVDNRPEPRGAPTGLMYREPSSPTASFESNKVIPQVLPVRKRQDRQQRTERRTETITEVYEEYQVVDGQKITTSRKVKDTVVVDGKVVKESDELAGNHPIHHHYDDKNLYKPSDPLPALLQGYSEGHTESIGGRRLTSIDIE